MANNTTKSAIKEERQAKPVLAIEKTLRNGAIAIAAAAVVVGSAPSAKAQLETNSMSLGNTSLSLQWSNPLLNPTVNSSTGGSQGYGAFNPALGTLDSITLSLSVSYNIQDNIQTADEYAAQDITSLSPYIAFPGFLGSASSGSTSIFGGIASNPYSDFTFDITSTSQTLSQSGTFTESLTFNSPSQLNTFMNSGSIAFSLPDNSSEDGPIEMPSVASGTALSAVSLNETVGTTISDVYTPEAAPEPNTAALAGLAGLSLLLFRRQRD